LDDSVSQHATAEDPSAEDSDPAREALAGGDGDADLAGGGEALAGGDAEPAGGDADPVGEALGALAEALDAGDKTAVRALLCDCGFSITEVDDMDLSVALAGGDANPAGGHADPAGEALVGGDGDAAPASAGEALAGGDADLADAGVVTCWADDFIGFYYFGGDDYSDPRRYWIFYEPRGTWPAPPTMVLHCAIEMLPVPEFLACLGVSMATLWYFSTHNAWAVSRVVGGDRSNTPSDRRQHLFAPRPMPSILER